MRFKHLFNFISGTLLSRLTGFVRELIFAYLLGGSAEADALFVAFRIPNLLRDLFAENSVQTAFVPVFIRVREKENRHNEFASLIITLLFIIIGVIMLVGILFAGDLVKLIAWGFYRTPERFKLTVELTRITFPFLLFISFAAVFGGILNAYQRFFIPAFSPVLYNIVIIGIGYGLIHGIVGVPHISPVYVLAFAIVVGGVVQMFFNLIFSIKQGFRFRLSRMKGLKPYLKEFFKLLVPVFLSVSFVNLTLFTSTEVASFLETGSIAYLSYAFRIMHLPIALIGVGISTVLLPSITVKITRGMPFKSDLRRAFWLAFLSLLPVVIFLILLPELPIKLIYQRGRFTIITTYKVSQALIFYALMIIPASLSKILQTVYFAMGKTRIPNLSFFIGGVLNIVLTILLGFHLSYPGIALAGFLSSSFRMLLLYAGLVKIV